MSQQITSVLSLTLPSQMQSITDDALDSTSTSDSEDYFGVLTNALGVPASASDYWETSLELPSLFMKKDLLPSYSILIFCSVFKDKVLLVPIFLRKSKLKAFLFFCFSKFSVFTAVLENSFNDRFFKFYEIVSLFG